MPDELDGIDLAGDADWPDWQICGAPAIALGVCDDSDDAESGVAER